ncbi:MAG: NAD(P)H-dependent oxidoreductase subunit E [Oligoflexia bacterium]|nr:NAD(P)H-dependent oxidoreductase subunit E [Oligoflexia bacterium]
MSLTLPPESKSYIQKELKRYETKESALIPALFEAQKVFGLITPEVIDLLSKEMDIPTSRVNEVFEFYTMFNKSKVGKYHIQVCTNISCSMVGAREYMQALCEKLNVKPCEVTADGKFSVSTAECLGSCGTAPMAEVTSRDADEYHENLKINEIDKFLGKFK